MYSLDEMSSNSLYNLPVNSMDVLSTNVRPHDVRGLQKLSITGLKRISINVRPHDARESMDVKSDIGMPGLNGLGPEYTLNGMNGLNGLGTELA